VGVSRGSGDIRVLDASTLDVLRDDCRGTRGPGGPRLTPDGSRLYVTVGRPGDVAVIDTATGKVVGRVATGTLPWGIVIVDVP